MSQKQECADEAVALTIRGDEEEQNQISADAAVECRICFMDEDPHDFSMPCSCTAPVHVGCLERWCQERGSPRCEICHTTYKLEGPRQQIIQNALEDHAERHRAPPQSALELLISGDTGGNGNEFTRMLAGLRSAQRNARNQDRETEEEFLRQLQTRRLLLLAAMVLMAIITVHILGTFLMSTTHSTGGMEATNGRLHPFLNHRTNSTFMNQGNATDHGRHYHANPHNSVMGRFFRMMLFFYVIRMLFSRPPPQQHRGVYL